MLQSILFKIQNTPLTFSYNLLSFLIYTSSSDYVLRWNNLTWASKMYIHYSQLEKLQGNDEIIIKEFMRKRTNEEIEHRLWHEKTKAY